MAEKHKRMIGKTYLYNGIEHTVTDVTLNTDESIQVTTNRKSLRFASEKIMKETLLPVEKEAGAASIEVFRSFREQNKSIDDLSTILTEAISKVEKDPKYVPQASTINGLAKTIIDIKKIQIDMIKTLRGQ